MAVSRFQTNDEIRLDIAGLTERIRQIRIDQGHPPDLIPSPEVVSIPLSLAIIERSEPFKAIAIKYAKVLAEGTAPRVDTDKLAQYEEWGRLLSYSKGFWCRWYGTGIRGLIGVIKRVNQAIDDEDESLDVMATMRRVHFFLSSCITRDSIRNDAYDYHRETGVTADVEKERLLSDPAAFQDAIDEALAQLHSKEEDMYYE